MDAAEGGDEGALVACVQAMVAGRAAQEVAEAGEGAGLGPERQWLGLVLGQRPRLALIMLISLQAGTFVPSRSSRLKFAAVAATAAWPCSTARDFLASFLCGFMPWPVVACRQDFCEPQPGPRQGGPARPAGG